jgi:hypothetical protein
MKAHKERYSLNAPGDFYVERDMCIICRAPEHAAPTLMGFFDGTDGSARDSHCYFKRQPATPEETRQAIEAVRVSCCGALRYEGDDPTIISALGEGNCDALEKG